MFFSAWRCTATYPQQGHNILKQFPDHKISQGGPISRLQHSPDLTLLKFFCEYIKNQVYVPIQLVTLENLKNIRNVIGNVHCEMLESIWQKTRLPFWCVQSHKHKTHWTLLVLTSCSALFPKMLLAQETSPLPHLWTLKLSYW